MERRDFRARHPAVPPPPKRDDESIFGAGSNHPGWGGPPQQERGPMNWDHSREVVMTKPRRRRGASSAASSSTDKTGNTARTKSSSSKTSSTGGEPAFSPVAATVTTTTTTKTTTKRQIYIPNPGIDISLRSLRYATDESFGVYDSLLRDFLVQTKLLRSSGAVDDRTLDAIWRDKITARIRTSRNPEARRKTIENVSFRNSESRRLIKEAIDRARTSISLLIHQASLSVSGSGGLDFEKARFSPDHDDDDSDFADARGGGNIIAIRNGSQGVLEKIRLLERQIRVARKAVEHCDSIAAIQPERGTFEYLVGWDIVHGLKKLNDQFGDWKKKYDWVCECKSPFLSLPFIL
ncbi:hypothetical protein QBC37DRAFT_414167 [Rhypophila decipiens]|uniref:Uncharacterized protein n=1 Tax=Rhypophila decipiens TaxID=261697 RepID=A0AAN6YK11_9PEZI|nr:hypothetical protein QBC37DRAFT_414167 [Rhypophila decipiens]